MKTKYYINAKRHLLTLKTPVIVASGSLLILIALNYMTTLMAHFLLVPFVLGGALFYAFIVLYRSVFLVKLPLIIMDDDSIQYFNVLWYNRHRWDKIVKATYNPEDVILSLAFANGGVFDRFMLASLAETDIDSILQAFKSKHKLTTS